MSNYDDIINRPRPELKHQRMPMDHRAAQFAPFSALNTLGEAIAETARITDPQLELSPDELMRLSRRLVSAFSHHRPVEVTYFQPDTVKNGGSYCIVTGLVKKIDETERILLISDHPPIPFNLITDIKYISENA